MLPAKWWSCIAYMYIIVIIIIIELLCSWIIIFAVIIFFNIIVILISLLVLLLLFFSIYYYYYWLLLLHIYISIYSFMEVIWRHIISWQKRQTSTISRCFHDMNPLLIQAARNPYWTLIWARPRLRRLGGWYHRFPKPFFCGLWLIWEYHVLKMGPVPVMIVARKNGTHEVGVLYSQRPMWIQANKPVNSHRPSIWAKCIVRTRRQVAWKMAR